MKKIVVIGAGFAGLSAVQTLARAKQGLEITLIDKKRSFDFLPMLPDVIGRGISAEFLYNNIEDLTGRLGVRFIQEEIIAVDLQKGELRTRARALDYDYLIIASGSRTNFYGQEQIARCAYKLDSVEDAKKLLQALRADKFNAFIVAGGGYTGIEVATNLRLLFDKLGRNKRIIIVELTSSLLGPLPQWMKDYVKSNLKELNIDILLDCKIQKAEEDKIYLSNKQIFPQAMLIWTAGVKAADFISALDIDKTRQGRIKVNQYLRFKNGCFAIGDAAEFVYRQRPLRMAVQFSIAQGEVAAVNILRHLRGVPLKKYRPVDLGYVIPMANNHSCGNILGINMRGLLPTLLHYLMCAYRSYTLRNKLGIIKDLIRTSA